MRLHRFINSLLYLIIQLEAKESRANENNGGIRFSFVLFWQARFLAAMQVIWACGDTACAPQILPPITHLPTSKRWTTELTVGFRFVVPTTGFEPTRADSMRFETLSLTHSATPSMSVIVIVRRKTNSTMI